MEQERQSPRKSLRLINLRRKTQRRIKMRRRRKKRIKKRKKSRLKTRRMTRRIRSLNLHSILISSSPVGREDSILKIHPSFNLSTS